MIIVNNRVLHGVSAGVQRYALEVQKRAMFDATISPPKEFASGIPGHLWEQFLLPRRVKRTDLLWSPCNTGPVQMENQVVTVHDLSPIDHPEWFSYSYASLYKAVLPRVLKKCRKIIADSDFTKSRIVDRYNIPDSKIETIYLGVSDLKDSHGCKEVNYYNYNGEPYFVTVSTISERKNLGNIIKAWSKFKINRHIPHKLLVIGEMPTNRLFKAVNLCDAPDVVYTGYISDAMLAFLYKGAVASIYLSLYEGFGLPPLESMYYGCPVICSSTTAVGEVVSNAGLMVNPVSVDEIIGAFEMFANSESSRRFYKKIGLEHVKKFSWDQTAVSTLNLLKDNL